VKKKQRLINRILEKTFIVEGNKIEQKLGKFQHQSVGVPGAADTETCAKLAGHE